MYKVCTWKTNQKWKRKSRQSWGNKSTYNNSADILLCFFFCTSWCRILYKFYLQGCLRKQQQSKDKRILSTPSTCPRLMLRCYTARSETRHRRPISGSFALYRKASHKVTGHPWNLDVFECTCKCHCHPKSLTFHWNQPLFLLTCTEVSFPRMTTRWQQRPTDGTHTLLLASHKSSFAF